MASPTKRRPLPALVLLVALTLLTSLVWWRVLHRNDGQAAAKASCVPPSASAAALPQPASVSLSVLNSTSRAGLAHVTATELTKKGFDVAGFGNDNPKVHVAGVAEIRFGPEQKKDATLLSYYLPGAKLVALPADPTGKVVVSLGAKFTHLVTAAVALAALKADHLTVAPPTPAKPTTTASASATC